MYFLIKKQFSRSKNQVKSIKTHLEKSNIRKEINVLRNKIDSIEISRAYFDYNIKKDLQVQLTEYQNMINSLQFQINSEKPEFSNINKKEGMEIGEYTNNFIKECFIHKFDWNHGLSEKLFQIKYFNHNERDEYEEYENYFNNNALLLEQKSASMMINDYDLNDKEILYNLYYLNESQKLEIQENDEIVNSSIKDQIIQEVAVSESNPDFSMTEDIDEKMKDVIHEGYYDFESKYNSHAMEYFENRSKGKGFFRYYL